MFDKMMFDPLLELGLWEVSVLENCKKNHLIQKTSQNKVETQIILNRSYHEVWLFIIINRLKFLFYSLKNNCM